MSCLGKDRAGEQVFDAAGVALPDAGGISDWREERKANDGWIDFGGTVT